MIYGETEKNGILLNDILGLSKEEIENTRVKFHVTTPGGTNPLDIWLDNPETINHQWLFHRKGEKGLRDSIKFKVGNIAISFIRIPNGEWLLSTIKKVSGEIPDVKNAAGWKGEEIDKYRHFFGRLVIKYEEHKRGDSQLAKFVDKIIVTKILPDKYGGDEFVGYDNVRLPFARLKSIIKKPGVWTDVLKAQQAVYVITDTQSGQLYIGSATSKDGMLLKRWSDYVENGHGGNKDLKSIVDEKGFSYIEKYFQYSIIENFNKNTDDYYIRARETFWKEVLCSRVFGLNAN